MCVCVQVEDCIKMAEVLLSDLPGFRAFVRFSDEVLEQLRSYEQEQFDDWTRDLISGLSDPKSGIRYTHTQLVRYCYPCRVLTKI